MRVGDSATVGVAGREGASVGVAVAVARTTSVAVGVAVVGVTVVVVAVIWAVGVTVVVAVGAAPGAVAVTTVLVAGTACSVDRGEGVRGTDDGLLPQPASVPAAANNTTSNPTAHTTEYLVCRACPITVFASLLG